MPAHIFLQLGLWADAEASDRAAFAASEAWVEAQGLAAGDAQLPRAGVAAVRAAAARAIHAKPAALIDEIAPVVKATGDLTLLSDLASMRAR